ncbi:hypothetical protein POM88_028142 [Heracleum sosnowskyi]|uniref:PDZ domain-containing protein n=1 Tax=Heracleum sosnowskyi TaxID=360622 RepID=A0AAD8IA18_9APIA|nr:hypothetical protein POM88_028142 [Heracleum sosnowskyi]
MPSYSTGYPWCSLPKGPVLRLRFPEERETRSLDARFDQSPDLKKILDHYVAANPSRSVYISLSSYRLSARDIERVNASVNKKELWDVYSKVTPSIVSVSSFLGVERKIDCSGLIIDWNSSENEATILTSAKLLWNEKDSALEFQLIVRTKDGTLLLAKEDYVDYYYNLLTLKVKSTVELNVVDLRSKEADIVDGMNVIAMGRDFDTCSLLDFSGKLYLENPHCGCDEILRSTCRTTEDCEGGPLITDSGYVAGINLNSGHPLPTPVILTCLEMWKSFRKIVRPWFGMSVVDVDQLPYEIWEKLNISPTGPYVVVNEVSRGSVADRNGVCSGDSVTTCNGIWIRSAKQYYQLLSARSQAMTCGNSGGQSFTVVIKPYDCRTDIISIEADKVSVDDERFYECWPRVAGEWNDKNRLLRNPGQRNQYPRYPQPSYYPC